MKGASKIVPSLAAGYTQTNVNRNPVLLTQRLRLRRWKQSDQLAYIDMNRDHEVMTYYPTTLEPMVTLSCITQSERNFDLLGFSIWAVEHRDTRKFIGCVGLEVGAGGLTKNAVAMSWQLARTYWDMGYGQEASEAVLAYAFETLEIPEIVAVAPEANFRSVHLARKLGFVADLFQKIEEPAWPLGHPCRNQLLFRLSREKFLEISR